MSPGWGCRGGLIGCVRGREGETQKTCYSAGVYVHYFKDIRQRALQSDCEMLFGGGQAALDTASGD